MITYTFEQTQEKKSAQLSTVKVQGSGPLRIELLVNTKLVTPNWVHML